MTDQNNEWDELREDYISNVLTYINLLQSTTIEDLSDLSLSKRLSDGRYYIAAANIPLQRFIDKKRKDAFSHLGHEAE